MENPASQENTDQWYASKILVIAWVLVFFPVGLYGVWKSDDFIRNVKFGVTVACIMGFFSLGINFSNPLYLFVLFPIALVLLWRAPEVSNGLTLRFAFAYPVVIGFAYLVAPHLPAIALF